MSDDDIRDDATRCYVAGCDRENEFLVHLRAEPWGGADLCLPHAADAVRASVTILICHCAFCARARSQLLGIGSDSVMALVDSGSGEWVVTTASGATHLIDMDARTVTRLRSGGGLRRDGEAVRLVQIRLCAVGYVGEFLLSAVAETNDVLTQRRTTKIFSIARV